MTGASPLLQTGIGDGRRERSSPRASKPCRSTAAITHVIARLTAGVVPPQPGARAPLMFAANGVQAGAEQLPPGRHRQQHEQRRFPERRRLCRQAADRCGRRDQGPDELVQRGVRPRRRRGAQHHAQVGDQQASRQRCGSSTATTALNANDFFANRAGLKKGEYLSNQFGLTGGGPVIRSKTFLFGDYEGSLIKQARTWVRAFRPRRQRSSGFTELLGPHLAAERHGRRRCPGAQLSARHGVRSGDDARSLTGRTGWIRSPGSWRRVPASCAMHSPATRFRPAGSIPMRSSCCSSTRRRTSPGC